MDFPHRSFGFLSCYPWFHCSYGRMRDIFQQLLYPQDDRHEFD